LSRSVQLIARKIDVVVSDVNLNSHCSVSKSAAAFSLLLHGIHFLKDEGVMAMSLL
jgi:type I restriction enzyme M protein